MEETEIGATLSETAPSLEPSALRPLERGTTVGRYVVLERIGSGGMGIVYAAYDPELDRRIALKLLEPNREASRRAVARGRLLREAQALAKLQHAHVVSVYDVGEHQGHVFLAMEHVDGPTLKRWLGGARRSWREIVDVFVRAARGLEAAHGKQLVHRDFKPDNVMLALAADGHTVERVLVMDFGLAVAAGDATSSELTPPPTSMAPHTNLTRTGAVLGTPAYMAPEQHLARPTDARSDQFSFCVSLYEALYGERPFAGATVPELYMNVTTGTVRPAPDGSGVPGWLREVVLRGLSADPAARWPTMADLSNALERDPTRRRRSLAGLGLALVAVAGAYGLSVAQDQRRVSGCHVVADAIDEVWNDDARARVRDGVLGLKVGYADETWARLEPSIDARVQTWRTHRFEACVADPPLPLDLQEIQADCFESTKLHISDRLEMLAEADVMVLEHALRAMAPQGTDDGCIAEEALERRALLPRDALRRASVSALYRCVERADLLIAAGKSEIALDLGTRCERIAVDLDDPRVAAHLQLYRGIALTQMNRSPEAEEALEAAFFGSWSEGDLATAVGTAIRLVGITSQGLGRLRDARRWARQAEVLLASIDPEPELRRAQLDHQLCNLEILAGNEREAIERCERALEGHTRELGDGSPSTIRVLKSLGSALDASGDNAQAVAHLETALARTITVFGDNHPDVADAYNDLAAGLMKSPEPDRARAHLERAIAIYEAAGLDVRVAVSLDNLSGIQMRQGDAQTALATSRRALEIRRATLPADSPTLAGNLLNQGVFLGLVNRHAEGIAAIEEALSIYERAFGPEHESVADAVYALGSMHAHAQARNIAFPMLKRALEIRRKVYAPGHPKVAAAAASLGLLAVKLERYDVALAEARRELAAMNPSTPHDAGLQAVLHTSIGQALLGQGDVTAAHSELERASELLDAANADAYDRAWSKFLLARVRWEARIDRPLAVEMARTSYETISAHPLAAREDVAEIQAWLRKRGAK